MLLKARSEDTVRADAAQREADLLHRRDLAELARHTAAADAAARREEQAARDAAVAERRAERRTRRRERRVALAAAGRAFRPVAPLLVVTGVAFFGQVAYGVDNYSPATWSLWPCLLVALGAAAGVESISLYVQWHAHDALLLKATATAARLRRASYVIALGVAAVNYSHFANGWKPTPAAIVFALFSASSPWLWGLHTRRAQHVQLLREGQADSTGAVFSAERWRAFPVRTWQARRWSIDHGVTDPREAWSGYNAERLERVARREAERRDDVEEMTLGPAADLAEDGLDQMLADEFFPAVQKLADSLGRRPTRQAVRDLTGVGATRADRLRNAVRTGPPVRTDEGGPDDDGEQA